MPFEQAFKILGIKDAKVKTASANGEDYSFSDRDATFCSFVTAHVKHANEAVLQSCREHADFWGIRGKCDAAIEKLSNWQRPERPDTDFALVRSGLRKFACYNADSTVEAAIDFHESRAKYPYAWRKEAATQLLARAEQFDANLPAYIETSLQKSAGFGYPTPESVEESLVCRLNQVKQAQDEYGEKLGQLLNHLIDNSDLRHDNDFVKCAMETLEQFDAQLGLTDRYDTDVLYPEDLISGENTLGALTKQAAALSPSVTLVNGADVDLGTLSKEALAAVDPGLAKMAEDELIDVLPTLPKGDADLLARLI